MLIYRCMFTPVSAQCPPHDAIGSCALMVTYHVHAWRYRYLSGRNEHSYSEQIFICFNVITTYVWCELDNAQECSTMHRTMYLTMHGQCTGQCIRQYTGLCTGLCTWLCAGICRWLRTGQCTLQCTRLCTGLCTRLHTAQDYLLEYE